MKALKFVLFLLIGLGAAFVLLGLLVPEIESRSEVTIAAPVDKSFAIYMDETRMGEWLEDFVRIENISGAPGEVGSRWRVVFLDERGEELEFIEEVTAYEANRRFAFSADSEDIAFDSETRFEPVPAGTRLEVITRLRGKDWITRSMLPLLSGHLEQRQAEDYARFQALVESSP